MGCDRIRWNRLVIKVKHSSIREITNRVTNAAVKLVTGSSLFVGLVTTEGNEENESMN